jgi:aminomethyltransferase
MPIGTPLHERTLPLCESLNYREWSGYYTVSSYETHHEHEYNAIRNAAALIDISPLFKYVIAGPDAARLVDRVITRDVSRMDVGGCSTPRGAMRRDTSSTTARCTVVGDDVQDDVGRSDAAVACAECPRLQRPARRCVGADGSTGAAGPPAADVLRACAIADIERLQYFRITSRNDPWCARSISRGRGTQATLATRSGSTRRRRSRPGTRSWLQDSRWTSSRGDAGAGRRPGRGRARLADVDYIGSRKALTDTQKYTPHEMGLGTPRRSTKATFIGKAPLADERPAVPVDRLSDSKWTGRA